MDASMTGAIGASRYDLLIIGGGPSGMSAASEAATHGLTVALVDERPTLGGQIYKQLGVGFQIHSDKSLGKDARKGRALIRETDDPLITIFLKSVVVDVEEDRVLLVKEEKSSLSLYFKRLLIAPGAYDRPVTFPGWTLPGVITAGGAQTLVKSQRVLPGERIFFAGSGPVALAFPAQLSKYGANIVASLEAGPAPHFSDIVRLLFAAKGNLDLILDAIHYRYLLFKSRVPVRYGRIVVCAEGEGRLEFVTHAAVDRNWRPISGTEERIAVDTLCVGYGFVPSVELFRLTNCDIDFDEGGWGLAVRVDNWGRTSNSHIFAAGDGAGVEGSYIAKASGRLAAIRIAIDVGAISEPDGIEFAESLRREVKARRAFQRVLSRMFRIGDGIFELLDENTIVCRCENVTTAEILKAIDTTSDPSVVKAFTRAGMGLCQGRNCQMQISALISKRTNIPMDQIPFATPRFPIRPVPLGAIADASIENEKFFLDVE
jgi:NADPH-dependent 2,4-dienoyl-CoA reductase/sulfur reductase-like enzyme